MAATTYSYDIASFPNKKVDTARLEQELVRSSITIALDHINQDGNSIVVVYKMALQPAEKGLLDTLIGQHSGEPLPTQAMPVSFEAPTTSDGKLIVQPSMFPGGVYLYLTGAGDDGGRGNGQQFAVQSEAAGDTSVEFHFNDWVYLSGGGFTWQGAEFGDSMTFDFYSPATPVAPNQAHTGNCNLVDPGVGAAILIVPANGNGSFDVDLAHGVPVPAYGPGGVGTVGFWDWSEPDTGKGTLMAGTAGKAAWHLFAAPIPLVKFANRIPVMGDGFVDISPPPIKSKKMLPHWKGRVTLHNSGHAGLKVAWYLATARASTT
jgi:hypothetical protein